MTEKQVLRTHRRAHREYLAGDAPVVHPVGKKKARPVPKERKQIEKPSQGLKQTDLVAFNQGAEKAAVQFLAEYIRRKGAPMFNMACNLIALELDVSTETAKRYLRKHSVDHPKARFCIEDGYVQIRRKEV
jgi:hypothetical protein